MSMFRYVLVFLLLLIKPLYAQDVASNSLDLEQVAPFQVFDNLYYVGSRSVSAWLLETDQGLILFDSLYGELTDHAVESIRRLGFDPNNIRYVMVSHAHVEQIGGARRFQDEFGSVVMMTEQDWQLAESESGREGFEPPRRHLSVVDGSTLNLGRTRLNFLVTPGHTSGVLSTVFTVYDNGYPHTALLFGGAGLDFQGAERTQMYIDSIGRLQRLENIEVNIPTYPQNSDVFDRATRLENRGAGDPHPFVDPESLQFWLQQLHTMAEAKLAREQSATN